MMRIITAAVAAVFLSGGAAHAQSDEAMERARTSLFHTLYQVAAYDQGDRVHRLMVEAGVAYHNRRIERNLAAEEPNADPNRPFAPDTWDEIGYSAAAEIQGFLRVQCFKGRMDRPTRAETLGSLRNHLFYQARLYTTAAQALRSEDIGKGLREAYSPSLETAAALISSVMAWDREAAAHFRALADVDKQTEVYADICGR